MPGAPIEVVITRTERYRRRQNAFDRWQRKFLILAALIDGFFGSLLYFGPTFTTTFYKLVVPTAHLGSIWVQLVGMLLMVMALIYLYAALDPARNIGVVVISMIGRLWATAFYLYYVFGLKAPMMYLPFAGLDALLFLLHIWALGPNRWFRVKSAFACRDLYP